MSATAMLTLLGAGERLGHRQAEYRLVAFCGAAARVRDWGVSVYGDSDADSNDVRLELVGERPSAVLVAGPALRAALEALGFEGVTLR